MRAAARVAGVVALAAAALLARDRLARAARHRPARARWAPEARPGVGGLASRAHPEASDAFDADGAVVSSPTTYAAVERAGGARVRARAAWVRSSAFPPASPVARATVRDVLERVLGSSDGENLPPTANAETRIRSRVVSLNAESASSSSRYGFRDGAFVAATFATAEVVDMLRNWIAHALFVARFSDVAIVALDRATLETCANASQTLFSPSAANFLSDDAADASRITCLDATRGFFQDADALRADAFTNGPLIGHRENKAVFNQIGIVKTRVLSALLRANVTTLMSDVDVVWLRNPTTYFASGELRRAHVAVSSDCVFGFEPNRPATDPFGQKPSPNNAEFNTGVLLLRPARQTRAFVERWTASQLETLETNREMNDQSHFNAVVNGANGGRVEIRAGDAYAWDDDVDDALATIVGSYGGEASSSHDTSRDTVRAVPESELFPEAHERGLRPRYYLAAADSNAEKVSRGDASAGRTRVALLPTGLFSNGHTFFVSRLAERSGVTPFAVHNTYQYSGTAGKIARFRENGLWAVDDAAYYDVGDANANAKERKFLLLKYDVPRHLADPARAKATPKGGTPHAHIELMTYQVNRVRDGLALASALNRTLVMPPLLSVCDRWFNLLPNCTQGDAQFPMLAPVDHAFLVFALDAFGGGGKYVEHAFFANRARFVARFGKHETQNKKEARDDDEDDEDDDETGTETETETRQTRSVSVPSLDSSFARQRFGGASEEKRRSASPRFRVVPGVRALRPVDRAGHSTVTRLASALLRRIRERRVRGGPATLGGRNDKLLVASVCGPARLRLRVRGEQDAAFHAKMTPLVHGGVAARTEPCRTSRRRTARRAAVYQVRSELLGGR